MVQAISNAIDFLHRNQLPYGEFRTYASSDPEMKSECRFDSSPFATPLVLYSLSFSPDDRVQAMTTKALDFLTAEMEGPGLWRYWSSRNPRHRQLPPDLDDICCISHILKQNGRPLPNNREIILANRNEEGSFFTWLAPRTTAPPELKDTINRLIGADTLLTILLSGTVNDVDCGVNANVLLYLGEDGETRKAIGYLVGVVLDDKEDECSHFYPDRLTFYYMLSRAYFGGVSSLVEAKSAVLDKLVPMQDGNGSFGTALLTALAACTLLNFDYRTQALHGAIEYLVASQEKDGSWPRSPLFLGPAPYYGSEELTTALCVEALSRTNCNR
jgi:hypothetical protein